MSSNQRKRKAASSKSRSKKRQRKNEDSEEILKENQLDEKEEKKEREVKEDIYAAALPLNDPDLVVGTVDKDLVCAICFALLTKPKGLSLFIWLPFSLDLTFRVHLLLFLIVVVAVLLLFFPSLAGFGCGHVFCKVCCIKLPKRVCPLDNQPINGTHPSPYLALKVSGLKMRCPNFKRGCKVEMLAGKEFQTVHKHIKVPSVVFCSLLFFELFRAPLVFFSRTGMRV
jgi:hypothetical protein